VSRNGRVGKNGKLAPVSALRRRLKREGTAFAIALLILGCASLLYPFTNASKHLGLSSYRPSRLGDAVEGVTLRVPRASSSIVLDGDADDWGMAEPGPARTGPFVLPTGAPARPHSEARMFWGDEYLYVLLYAADDDIRSRGRHPGRAVGAEDSFLLRFFRDGAEYSIEVSPDGAVTDTARDPAWHSRAQISPEVDGTLDEGRDVDEEWSLEMAIPFASLDMKGEKGESVRFSAERCDAPKGGERACAGWGEREAGRLVIE
jgi:hypothetical protein